MTETGLSLGTPHYMSPEQATAEKNLTNRSDVYSLGAVLYEMLTGEPPHTGASAQAIVMKIVTDDVRPVTELRKSVPPHVAAATAKSLEKLAADRFASAAEFAEALGDASYGTSAAVSVSAAMSRGDRRGWLTRLQVPIAALGGFAIGAILFAALQPTPSLPVARYGLALPAAQAPNPKFLAIPSPDGSRIVYVGPGEGGNQLWVKERHRYDATPLAGTLNVTNFTFSPDGEWIAFVLGMQLKKLPVVGGAAITLADSVAANPGLAWLDDGSIVYIQFGGLQLRRVPAVGGQSTVVVADSATLLFPTPLPGGRGVLFTRCLGFCNIEQDLWALDLRSGTSHRVLAGAAIGRYVATGHLVYVRRDGGMFAAPFDLGSLEMRGSSVPLMDSVLLIDNFRPLMALSSTGTLVLRTGASLSLRRFEMVWVGRDGSETPIDSTWTFRFTNFGANAGWALSPDGTRLAIGLFTDAGDDIWVKQLPSGPLSRVSYDDAAEYRPRWMPDGRSIMFGSNRPGEGGGGLYSRPADGTGSDSLILRAAGGIFEGAWSPDGQWLLFRTGGRIGQTGGRDIVGIRPGVDSVPVSVVVTPYDEEAIAMSPAGRWLAYESNETGRTEVFIRPFPNTETAKWQVSNGGGEAPLWARDGRELFYVNADRAMVAVTVGTGDELQLGERRVLFRLRNELYLAALEFYTPYDIGPDGRFIMARSVTPPSTVEAPLIVVENFFEELKAKVGN
ncbi:MAG: PD40 domain-containing protein, partial [Gemmatimonadetes bacterium]|nr:PD40 domain-containing protein [Gemmatimonadota bacterium]